MFCTYNAGSEPVAEGGFHFQPRYLAPILPLAALYFVSGIDWLFSGLGRWLKIAGLCRNAVIAAVGGYALLTSLAVGGICLKNTWRFRGLAAWAPERVQSSGNEDDMAFARYIETADWAAAHLPSNAVIGSRKPQHTLLFSGLHRRFASGTTRCVKPADSTYSSVMAVGVRKYLHSACR